MAGTEAFGAIMLNLAALFLMGGPGIPLGIPPAAENPLMAKSAPEDCIVYFSWAARQTEIDPESPNSTERILAEPSVQELISSVYDALGGSSGGLAEVSDEEGAEELRAVTSRVARLVFSNAGAVFIEDIKNEIPTGGFLLDVGSEADDLRAELLALQAKKYKGIEIPTTTHFDESFHWLPETQPGGVKVAWGVKGRYLIVGLGENSIKSIFANAVTEPPKWLSDAQAADETERRAQTGYINLRRIMEEAAKQEGRTLEEIEELNKIGVGDISHVTYVGGLNKTGYETHIHLHTGGERLGVLSVLNGKPLALADLKGIPADAALVSAMRLNMGDFYDEMSKITKAEIGEEEYNKGLKEAEEQLGFSVRDGLIASLGDVWRAYSSPTEGGIVTGWTMVADVKDRQKLESLNAKLVKAVNDYADTHQDESKAWDSIVPPPQAVPFDDAEFEDSFEVDGVEPIEEDLRDIRPEELRIDDTPDEFFGIQPDDTEPAADGFDADEFGEKGFAEEDFGEEEFRELEIESNPIADALQMALVGSVRIKEKEVAGKPYYMAHFTSYLVPVAPSWGFTDDHLVVGLYPQTVKEFLTRPEGLKTLDTNPELANRLGDDTIGVAQVDSKAMFETVYSFLEMAMFSAAAVETDENTDSAALLKAITSMPATADIAQHMKPSTILIRPTAEGVEMVSHQSFPGGGIGALSPIAAAAMVPAVMAARASARRSQATNNLKQIGLAFHNYHDVHRHFPASYSVDADGKPLLSWRVHVLPYIEESNLYERFHLDEPWDSDHNKKLIAEMPDSLRGVGSTAAPGKTNYLAVAGDDYLLAQPKKKEDANRSFADIRDGTSNTIAFVEVADERAVIWTKPADYTPDAMNPWGGLIGLRKGGFLAAFADGSVSMLFKSDNDKGLMALFTRSGGEATDRWDFEYGGDDDVTFDRDAEFGEVIEGEFGEEPRFEEGSEDASRDAVREFVPGDDPVFPTEPASPE